MPESLKDTLIALESMKVKAGTISSCSSPNSKYYDIRKRILEATSFLPDDVVMGIRTYYIIHDMTERKKCACGCGEFVVKPWKNYVASHGNGTDEVKNKKKESFLKRYGVENPSQAKEIKDAKKRTCQEHYGADNHMSSPEFYEQYKKALKVKTGYENQFQIPAIRKVICEKMGYDIEQLAQRGRSKSENFYKSMVDGDRMEGLVTPMFSCDEYRGVMENGKFIDYKFKCNECGKEFTSKIVGDRIPRCRICRPVENTTSQIERDLQDYIVSIYSGIVEFQNNKFLEHGLELDIRIPDKKLSIEVDGLYYHSEMSGGKHRAYHLMKTQACEVKGERLIHIFEDELANPVKKRIAYSRLRHILGLTRFRIAARDCVVREIDSELKRKFLRKYHIQGSDKSALSYGLFYKNRLVAVMTFGGNRVALGQTAASGEWELVRYATVFNFNIMGGADKLLKYFERNHNPKVLKSYADRRWSQGGLYSRLGFENAGVTAMGYWYVEFRSDYPIRHHRYKFRKDVLVSEGYDASKSEWEIMVERGFDRVWDCGHYLFVKKYAYQPHFEI